MSETELIRVLSIETEAGDIQISLHRFARMHFDVTRICSLREALQEEVESSYDVLLLDLPHAETEALETVRIARQSAKRIPIIALTAPDQTDFCQKMLDAGATDYLVKGDFGHNGLAHCIRNALHRVKLEDALCRSESRFRTLYDSTVDAVMLLDEQSVFDCNEATLTVFGCASQEAFYLHLADLSPPEQPCGANSRTLADQKIAQALNEGNQHFDWVFERADTGASFPAEVMLSRTILESKPILQAVVRDLSERKLAEELTWRQTHFDGLTQLPNRQMFHERLKQGVEDSAGADMSLALFLIDIDRLKEINEHLGYDEGDSLLIEAARRIGASVRESDTVARLDGDEFAVILPEIAVPTNIERVAQKIIQALNQPYASGDETTRLSASIGIAFYPNDAVTIKELLYNAERAMYEAKNAGRNRFSYFAQPCDGPHNVASPDTTTG
ncbi:diguanylate cyclase [Candidatus Methylospira mobilis]|uniref:Diguanylate cyclase n=1 Tax=Candidatus Methylospira mobilis TaxID=1808979 RepID=A0A5Q0BJA1_9GAMM|nr:diguanylate cyclase [Candidatus Methylospira mobilis]QFY42254.1 diguanylate cyclase [Candidatus Methylospira mobilis]WNV03275.1 diguanylate cyclase [Candidatus Methylospira mobilis]